MIPGRPKVGRTYVFLDAIGVASIACFQEPAQVGFGKWVREPRDEAKIGLVGGPRRWVSSQCARYGFDAGGVDLALEHPVLLEDVPELPRPGVETDWFGAQLIGEENLNRML